MTIHLVGIQKIVLHPLATAVKHKGLIAEVVFPSSYWKHKTGKHDAICAIQYLFGLLSSQMFTIEWGKLGEQSQALYYVAVIPELDEDKPMVFEIHNKDWKEEQIVRLVAVIRILAEHWKWEIEEV